MSSARRRSAMSAHPGFCIECKAPLDPGDDSRECWVCDADEYTPLWDYPDGDPSGYLWDLWTAQQEARSTIRPP